MCPLHVFWSSILGNCVVVWLLEDQNVYIMEHHVNFSFSCWRGEILSKVCEKKYAWAKFSKRSTEEVIASSLSRKDALPVICISDKWAPGRVAVSHLFLKNSTNGAPTTSKGKPFHDILEGFLIEMAENVSVDSWPAKGCSGLSWLSPVTQQQMYPKYGQLTSDSSELHWV